MNIIKMLVKKGLNMLGFDLIRSYNNPELTVLGLKTINIKTIIDVGANEGQFAKHIRKIFPNACIYSFEPLTEQYEKIRSWAEKDGKAKAFNVALGESEGEGSIFLHLEHTPSSSLLKTTHKCQEYYTFTKNQKAVKIKIETLDGIINKEGLNLTPEILMKVDVQGYEDRVIKGAYKTMRRIKACILEINLFELYEEQANFKDLVIMLYDLGFKYAGNLQQSFDKDGNVVFIDALFLR